MFIAACIRMDACLASNKKEPLHLMNAAGKLLFEAAIVASLFASFAFILAKKLTDKLPTAVLLIFCVCMKGFQCVKSVFQFTTRQLHLGFSNQPLIYCKVVLMPQQ